MALSLKELTPKLYKREIRAHKTSGGGGEGGREAHMFIYHISVINNIKVKNSK